MKSILLKAGVFIFLTVFSVSLLAENEGKDIIIVLDTSQSMIGKGGKDVMPVVKESLKSEIDKFNPGDSLTFMTFDTDVKTYPTVILNDDNDKNIVKNFVSMVEAQGWWTFTDNMIRVVAQKTAEFKSLNPDRLQIVLIFTDALDDPPPAERNKRISITDFADLQSDYVYVINLSKTGMGTLEDKLQSKTSGKVEVIDAGDNTESALDNIGAKIDEKEKEFSRKNRPFYFNPFFIAALLTAIVLGVLLYMMRVAKYRVAGILKYRNLDNVRVEWEETDLTRFVRKRISVGKSPAFEHYLRDYDDTKPLVLEAVNFRGNIKVAVNENAGIQVEYKGDKKESFLKDGDTFTASNYEFIYLEQAGD